MKKVSELLRQHPFAEELGDEVIDMIVGCAKNVVFQENEYVFLEGDEARYFYLIRHGAVALEMFVPGRGPLTFLTVKSGEILGLSWLVPPYRWSYDARAVETTRTIAFECACLRDKCESQPHVGYAMLKRFVPPLIDRLEMARIQSANVYGDVENKSQD